MGWDLLWQVPLGIIVYFVVVLPIASLLGTIINRGSKDVIEYVGDEQLTKEKEEDV